MVILSVEDDPEDTVRPRLDAAGADPRRIALMTGVEEIALGSCQQPHMRIPMLSDIEPLRDAIAEYEARLLVVDPLMAYLGGDAHRDQDVRQTLAPLAKLASEKGIAVVVVRHLNKSGGSNALYRGGGSIGIIGAARVGLLIAKEPGDETGRVVAVTKCNLATPPPSLRYRVIADDGVPAVAWGGVSEHTASTLLSEPQEDGSASAIDEAMAFLRERLASGPQLSNEIKRQAKVAGIARRTLERAVKRLGVKCAPSGQAGPWQWRLPATAPESATVASVRHDEGVADTGNTDPRISTFESREVAALGRVGCDSPSAALAAIPAEGRKSVRMVLDVFPEARIESYRDLAGGHHA